MQMIGIFLLLGICSIVQSRFYDDKHENFGISSVEKINTCILQDVDLISKCQISDFVENLSLNNGSVIVQVEKSLPWNEPALKEFSRKQVFHRRVASVRQFRDVREKWNPIGKIRNYRIKSYSHSTFPSYRKLKDTFRRSIITQRRERLLSEDENRNRQRRDISTTAFRTTESTFQSSFVDTRRSRCLFDTRNSPNDNKNLASVRNPSNIRLGNAILIERRYRSATDEGRRNLRRISIRSPNYDVRHSNRNILKTPFINLEENSRLNPKLSSRRASPELRRHLDIRMSETHFSNIIEKKEFHDGKARINGRVLPRMIVREVRVVREETKMTKSDKSRSVEDAREEFRSTRSTPNRMSNAERRTSTSQRDVRLSIENRRTNRFEGYRQNDLQIGRSIVRTERTASRNGRRLESENSRFVYKTRDSERRFEVRFLDDWQELNKFSYLRSNSRNKGRIQGLSNNENEEKIEETDYQIGFLTTRLLEIAIAAVIILNFKFENGKGIPVWNIFSSVLPYSDK